MQKKILSIYLVIAICFLSIFYCAIPVYAASPVPNWQAIYTVDSSQDAKIIGDFKNTEAMQLYHSLSESEKRLVDLQYYASMVDTYGDTNFEPANNIKSQIKDTMVSILGVAGITYAGFKDFSDYLGIHKKIAETSQKSGGLKKSLGLSDTATINGKINVSKDFINNLRSNVATNYGYKIYPALPSNPVDFYELYNYPKNDSDYDEFVEYWSDKSKMYSFVCFVPQSWSVDYLGFYVMKEINYFSDKVFFVDQYNRMSYLFTDGSLSGGLVNADYRISLSANGTVTGLNGGVNSTNFIGVTGRSLVVYNNKESAKNHLIELLGQSKPSIFIANNSVNNDYSTTVNKIYNYANNGCADVIQGQIDKAITDKGSGLTDEEYQKIVNDVTKQLQEKIDKDDSGNTGGGSGGDSGNTGGGSGGDSGNTGGGESNTWLEKIYNRLGDILEKIGTVTGVDTLVSLVQQIADDVHKLKNGEAIAPDMSVTNGLLSDIAASLKTLIGVSAAGDISDLLADTVGDKISDYIGNVKNAATEMTDALQEVFPFSIPWDLMAIFGLFSAESKAPVFDIPIVVPSLGINETFHIDFSDFEYISVICRTMLGISFAVGLMWITIELTKEGD